MIIDDYTTILNPTINISWSFDKPNFLVSANFVNDVNSYSRLIGTFTYSTEWLFTPNSENTNDVNQYFKDIKIEDLKISDLSYYEPPRLYPYAIEIPDIYLWVFPENKFVLNKFEIPLDTINGVKCVNLAYFNWVAFRDELDSGNYIYLKRALMPLWDYVAEQVENNNLIVL
jgi:hypothetical protein